MMKTLRILTLLLLLTAGAFAQTTINITTNSSDCSTANSCAVLSLNSLATNGAVSFQITGTWTGTLTFEATVDGTNYNAILVYPTNGTTGVTTATANNLYVAPASSVGAAVKVRVRGSAAMTGTVTGTISPSNASAKMGGGGGGGGVGTFPITTNIVKGDGAGNGVASQVTDDGTHAVASPNGFGTGLTGGLTQDMPNAASVGTGANLMACQTAGAYTVQSCATNATDGSVGVAVAGVGTAPGTTGNVSLCYGGKCSVKFDNQTVAGHNAIHSTTAIGQLHDTGAATPTSGVENFLIDSANSGAGTVATIKMLTPDTVALQTLTKVTATLPITATAAGNNTNISTSLPNLNFPCRYSAGTGVMQNCTFGGGLSLDGSGALSTKARTACTTDLAPAATDDLLVTILNPATAVHVTRFSCGVTGTTSVIANLVKGGNSLISDATCTAGDANQVVVTTFANGSSQCGGTSSCAVAAHAPVTVHVGTIVGTPTGVTWCVDYTVD